MPKPARYLHSKTAPLPDWRWSDDRFRIGTTCRETPEEIAEKERLIAEFKAKKKS